LIESQSFRQILDVTQHEFPFARARGNARALLCVPLRRDDKLLGYCLRSWRGAAVH